MSRRAPHALAAARRLSLWPGHASAACALAIVLALLAGCAGTPGVRTVETSPPSAPAAPAPAAPPATRPGEMRTAFAEAMSVEAQWLRAWFRDTPVRVTQGADGQLAVEVPRQFCFERGRAELLPALGAMLDKVAELMRRRPDTRLVLLVAPGDGASTAALALQRAARVQRHLRDRGLPPERLGEPTAGAGAAVTLRLGPLPAAPPLGAVPHQPRG